MRIAEISTDLLSPVKVSHSQSLLDDIDSSIEEAERLSPSAPAAAASLSAKLQNSLSRLNSALPLTESAKLHLWKLSYRLWNACVDLSNANADTISSKIGEDNAKLRHIASDLLFLAGPVPGIPSPAFKSASFYYKTGLIWHDLRKFDLAAVCFDRATDLISKIAIETISDAEERRFLMDLNLARSRAAWEGSERNLALALLSRSKTLLLGDLENYRDLSEQFLQFGKIFLQSDQRTTIEEAVKLIGEAVDLCEKGMAVIGKRSDETVDLMNLRSRSLRFLAAAHLQAEEFESVVKCVRVLRDGTCGAEHASVGFLALKAWLGMGRRTEAEKELRNMVVNKGVPEAICVSAVETFFEGAGAAGVETVKGVFLGLLERCHVSAGSAVRVVHRVAAGVGEGSRIRAKVVSELASDERVVALFAGDEKVKERRAMHAVLWNSGAEYFRSKDYNTSAEMFEKSMLYIPHDVENRILRAKSFRVLCLCHLALSQLDQAEEYINEAQKLEPNIACAFLKFKIHLQKNDGSTAMNQIQSMVDCVDFNPEFLTLAAHEAMACRALPVAIASLSTLLNLYTPGKPMPMPEVAVLRNAIALLFQNSDSQGEVMKFLKRARTRMVDLGPERFFGSGSVGSRELKWFAGNSWNMGIETARDKKYDFCKEFFALASEFYGAMGDEADTGSKAMVCKSLIMSVAAMIGGEQSESVFADSDVKSGLELLGRAGQILASISAPGQVGDDRSTIKPSFFFLHTLNTYHLLCHLDDTQPQQLLLVKNFASTKACTPEYLLQIGLVACQGRRSNHEVASFALNTCLTALFASPSPDYQTIALVIRKLILLTGLQNGDVDGEAYTMYRQAYRFMMGLKEGDYPADEGKWLTTTAWNRSVVPGRLGQMDLAKRWMKMGIELAQLVPGTDGYKDCMEECLGRIEKVGGDGGGEQQS